MKGKNLFTHCCRCGKPKHSLFGAGACRARRKQPVGTKVWYWYGDDKTGWKRRPATVMKHWPDISVDLDYHDDMNPKHGRAFPALLTLRKTFNAA